MARDTGEVTALRAGLITRPMPRPQPPAKIRVGLREVAAAAKVSVMTVSLALRDNPRISAATRERVKRLAGELGYHPDPELSRLMNHLRVSRTARGRIGIAVIDFYPASDHPENPYNLAVRHGAAQRAEELGFGFSSFHLADYRHNLGNLLKVVRARGLEAAMLMPAVTPMALDLSASWDGLSVVATSKSIFNPRFHCTIPNQFGNMMHFLETVRLRGYRRVCAVFDQFFDERTTHNFTAALRWSGHGDLMLVVPQALPPEAKRALVVAWFERHQPDVVFAQCDAAVPAAAQVKAAQPGLRFQVVGLGEHNSAGFAYIDERADLIGIAAIDLLAGMVYHHECGIPEHPRTTLIDGRLVFPPEPAAAAPRTTRRRLR